jgi:predicted glycosyltransferase
MKIWIDLSNAPHVVFFLPIINKLSAENHEITVTLRDFNQTVELARLYGLKGTLIGHHGGKSAAGKFFNLFKRTFQLLKFAKRHKFDLAVSHNSYTHILAARLCLIKSVTLMDYEGQPANHLAFRLADKVVVPDCFPEQSLKKFGAHPRRVYKYGGFKEQLYLSDFNPDPHFPEALKIAAHLPVGWDIAENILIVVRTPATMAAYHSFANPLFEVLLKRLNAADGLTTLLFPRYPDQRNELQKNYENLIIPDRPLDGMNLVYHADLVISAGGTMNREAAILGTPAYTNFAGRIPAVDHALIASGRMSAIASEKDIHAIRFIKKIFIKPLSNRFLLEEIIGQLTRPFNDSVQ